MVIFNKMIATPNIRPALLLLLTLKPAFEIDLRQKNEQGPRAPGCGCELYSPRFVHFAGSFLNEAAA